MPPKDSSSDNPFSAGDTKLIICLIKHLKGDLRVSRLATDDI